MCKVEILFAIAYTIRFKNIYIINNNCIIVRNNETKKINLIFLNYFLINFIYSLLKNKSEKELESLIDVDHRFSALELKNLLLSIKTKKVTYHKIRDFPNIPYNNSLYLVIKQDHFYKVKHL
jgi:hypothetical protein